MRLIACLAALVLPPLAVWMIRGAGPALWLSLGLAVIAQAVFWGAFAGPGVALWALAVLHALVVALLFSRIPGE